MSSFGKWYEDQQQTQAGGDVESGGSSWTSMEMSSLINTEGLPSFEGMKQSLESSMPKKILGMGYHQRFKVFCALLFLSVLFFALAFFVGLPMIMLKPQKFALSFTCGSLTFMGSFGILKGPKEHIMGMLAADRILFTTIYVGSMLLTLWLNFTKGGLRGYALVMAASVVQLVALLWYLISFLPGGTTGLQIVSRAIWTMLQPILAGCLRLQAKCVATMVNYWARG